MPPVLPRLHVNAHPLCQQHIYTTPSPPGSPSRCWKKGARVFSNSYGRTIRTATVDATNLAQKKAIETLTKQGKPEAERRLGAELSLSRGKKGRRH